MYIEDFAFYSQNLQSKQIERLMNFISVLILQSACCSNRKEESVSDSGMTSLNSSSLLQGHAVCIVCL